VYVAVGNFSKEQAWHHLIKMYNINGIRLDQGSPIFLSEGRISYYTTFGRPDILRNVIVSGYVAFYQINKFFVNICFHYGIDKMFLQPNEIASQAGQNGFASTVDKAGGP